MYNVDFTNFWVGEDIFVFKIIQVDISSKEFSHLDKITQVSIWYWEGMDPNMNLGR